MLISSQEIYDTLNTDKLIEDARREARLNDFGDDRLWFTLEKMQKHLASDVKLDPAGLEDVRRTTIRQLVNRLRFQQDLRQHPEILDEDVSDPIIILGTPRSGTTKTHRMMGADPNVFATRMWQLVNPAPFPNAPAQEPDPRIQAARTQDKLINESETNPALRAAHLYGSEEIQEDLFLFGLTFNCPYYSAGRPLSDSFFDYLKSRKEPSDLDNYKYIASLFKYLQWQQGGRKGRRWVMKHTGHIGFLEELLKTYPKATLVHIHRSPLVSIPSLLRLSQEWYLPYNRELDATEIAYQQLERQRWIMDRYMSSRARMGLDGQILDVPYEQIRNNPMPVFREIYRRASHTMSPESEQAMIDYEHLNEQGKHGAHQYSLEMFGLSEEKIRDYFGAYMEKFIDNPIRPVTD